MTEEQFISILPLFRGTVKQARAALAAYPEIRRIDIGVIRKILGYSGEKLKANATPEILEEMIDKYRNGEGTLRSLATSYHVAPKTLQRALHKAGFDTSRQDTWTTIKEKRFLKYISDGMTYTEIAKLFNISVSAVSQKAHRLGIPNVKPGHPSKYKKGAITRR
jgi:DNA invertase Pin-like site-specific DNA recombinase